MTFTPEQVSALREFALSIVDVPASEFGPDPFDLWDNAVRLGLLVGEERTEFCGEGCNCAEHHDEGDVFTCYKTAPWLRASSEVTP